MATTFEEAKATAEEAAIGPSDRMLERLADIIGAKASVQAVFGEPIKEGDITIIPVAKVRWGFGGGTGQSEVPSEGPATGSGAGGGATAEPLGYLEIGSDGAEFIPITDARPSPVFIIAAGITAALVLRGVAKLLGR